MTTETLTRTIISLDGACDRAECAHFAFPLHRQLVRGYEVCSVLPNPGTKLAWRAGHRTARKRADRAERLGYRSDRIRREEHEDAIFAINTSLDERQGRPMSGGYRERPNFLPLPDYPCDRHAIRTYGVLDVRGVLVAYLWLYRSGELALVSSILGHGEHLANDVMYLLFQGVVVAQSGLGGYFVYNRADSGTDGLRYFKAKLGFEAMEVEWAL